MKVSMIGSGYVGLVTGACLAERGHQVWCVDSDPAKIASIARGVAPFHEPGLDPLLKRNAGQGLRGTTDLPGAVLDSELTMLAVGTPNGSTAKARTKRKRPMNPTARRRSKR
jgi:UDPglucose 6-dehydrogenase/GDP-mannose 6-dehydrogenase